MPLIAAGARLAALAAFLLLLTATRSSVATSAAPDNEVEVGSNAVTHWRASYCTQPQATILLDYKGPLREYRGRLCYGFAGYSETCFVPKSRWLTPATRWRLPGPGQIPQDLLPGYTLLIRLPDVEHQPIPMQPGRCT